MPAIKGPTGPKQSAHRVVVRRLTGGARTIAAPTMGGKAAILARLEPSGRSPVVVGANSRPVSTGGGRLQSGTQLHAQEVANQLLASAHREGLLGNIHSATIETSVPRGVRGVSNYGQAFPLPISRRGKQAENQGAIYVAPGMLSDLTGSSVGPYHERGLAALLHELVHTGQSSQTFALGPSTYEGGASAFTHLHGRQVIGGAGLGVGYGDVVSPPMDFYRRAVLGVLSHFGPAWVAHGQFTNAPLPGEIWSNP